MNDIQQSELIFYLPVIGSYALACLIAWMLFKQLKLQSGCDDYHVEKPWLELGLAMLAIILVFGIGRLYSAGYLIPPTFNPIGWMLNNLIIYSPIFIVIWVRKQPGSTIWLNNKSLLLKLAIGSIAAFASVLLFLTLRVEWGRWLEVLYSSFSIKGLSNFIAIFLEGVAIAFLFIRLKWVSNVKVALTIPAILFAFAHMPGMLADGDPWWHMLLMSIVTGGITVFVLYTCDKTKDIIWLGIVHYFMDAAIRAF